MFGDVEAGDLIFFIDAQTTAGPAGDFGEDQGACDGPAQHERACLYLFEPECLPDEAGEVWCAEVGVGGGGGEDAREDRAERTADRVDAEGIERIVIAEFPFEHIAREEGRGAGGESDADGAAGGDEATGRGDRREAGDGAGAEAEHAGLAVAQVFEGRPHEAASGGGERGGDEGVDGHTVGGDGAAGIEAVPAGPQHAGADHTKDHAMRRHGLPAVAAAFSEEDAQRERAPAGGHVDDDAAGEVDGLDGAGGIAEAIHPAADAPDHVCDGEIDDKHPEGTEEDDSRELHALGDGADGERRGDDREHHLVDGEEAVGDPGRVVGIGGHADIAEEDVVESAEEGPAWGKGEAVADGPPQQADDAGERKALGKDGEHVFAADQPAVEECQAGEGHKEDQGGTRHDPGAVARARAGDFGDGLAVSGARAVVHVGLKIGESLLDGGLRKCGGRGGGLGLGACGRNETGEEDEEEAGLHDGQRVEGRRVCTQGRSRIWAPWARVSFGVAGRDGGDSHAARLRK
ncbi:MAG: hypothetical protein BWX86_00802 [Verrucomicrobia bacterium ADurb.Bin122]|nr:MAG: hypothetical protein BWX86_00802 [Verrucomicrobia bacterium ADurb.Bin122]